MKIKSRQDKRQPTITLHIVEGPITPLQRQLTNKFWTKLISDVKRSETENEPKRCPACRKYRRVSIVVVDDTGAGESK